MDEVQKLILAWSKETGNSLAGTSLALGKNHAYLQQFIQRGRPRQLPETVRHQLAALMEVDQSKLMSQNQLLAQSRPARLEQLDTSFDTGQFDFMLADPETIRAVMIKDNRILAEQKFDQRELDRWIDKLTRLKALAS